MATNTTDPRIEKARVAAARILAQVTSVKISGATDYPSERTDVGSELGPPYLVYFTLVDLLKFYNQGQAEKVAWSVPVFFKEKLFIIEHRKLGLRIDASDAEQDKAEAKELAVLVRKAVSAARLYFDYLAEEAVKLSELNVVNRSGPLFRRYAYFRSEYQKKKHLADKRRGVSRMKKLRGKGKYSLVVPSVKLEREARMLAQAAIDAFFSWTEHIFVHLALLSNAISTAAEVVELSQAEWSVKFKAALGITDPKAKKLHDDLVEIRRQMRNFVAHGSFGKQGEAFHFHSSAGAVPVLLPHRRGKPKLTLTAGQSFEEEAALVSVEELIGYMSSGARAPGWHYAQEAGLDTILTMVADGTYRSAMASAEEMSQFVTYLGGRFDQAIDMDW